MKKKILGSGTGKDTKRNPSCVTVQQFSDALKTQNQGEIYKNMSESESRSKGKDLVSGEVTCFWIRICSRFLLWFVLQGIILA